MWDYYSYLWLTTWPYISLFCLIWGFILSRTDWKFRTVWRTARKARSFLWLGGKVIIWTAVLAVYTHFLLLSQPDWLSQPGSISGTVEEMRYDLEAGAYVIAVGGNETQRWFYIDSRVFEEVNINDQVDLLYLPVRREVVRCELTGSLADVSRQ